MIHRELADYYLSQGLAPERFWIGPEHPALEELALSILRERESKRVLEIGYQAGGFAVPIIYALHNLPEFHYTGIDNLGYHNSVSNELISSFLAIQRIPEDKYLFKIADAWDFLMTCEEKFDLVLIDHVKRLYPRELGAVFVGELLAPSGVILLHDVLHEAADAWRRCAKLCKLFGCSWEINQEVPAGVAIVHTRARPYSRKVSVWGYRVALQFRYKAKRIGKLWADSEAM